MRLDSSVGVLGVQRRHEARPSVLPQSEGSALTSGDTRSSSMFSLFRADPLIYNIIIYGLVCVLETISAFFLFV